MTAIRTGSLLAVLTLASAEAADPQPAGVIRLDEMVVTAPHRSEPLSHTAATIQIIPEERIRNSTAKSLTDLLAENAVGFFSEWTPGQTSINLRGAATDGQGKDFRSQVTVLLNGRRAGTANLSKLSLSDVARVEIIRGPASVVYGSAAMGGVINIITRTGRNTEEGSVAKAQGGSWGAIQGHLSTAGDVGPVDYYAGIAGGKRDDYDSPGGKMTNTSYERYGGLASLGWDISTDHRLEITARSDGAYDTGFRGSQWDTNNVEDRYNQSFDAIWSGALPGGRFSWTTQLYAFHDVDDFKWGSERARTGAAGYSVDNNKRTLDAIGAKLLPQVKLSPTNDLLLGLDLEQAKLRSERFRIPVPGAANTQIPPFDNDEDNFSLGLYAEDVQRLWDDRVTLRGGLRYSYGDLTVLRTPNQPLLRESSQSFDTVTYSVGGAFAATDWLKLRTGVATGYRAPTASELAADFTAVGGSQIIGNAGLEPESSLQYEAGATLTGRNAFLDIALFENNIQDRITTRSLTATRSQYVNSPGDVVVRGLEARAEYDVAGGFGMSSLFRIFANAVWNFDMEDKGADAALTGSNRRKPQRMYEYQAAFGAVYGERNSWDLRLGAILRGPIFYDTEEALLIPQGEPNDRYVHRKSPFWVFNMRANWYVTPGIMLFGAVNNIFDEDEHPLFIALNKRPYISDPRSSNGERGNSMPGREFLVGAQVKF